MQKITPFLLINGRAEMVMNFYTSVFKNSKGRGHLAQRRQLDGERFMLLNTGPNAEFSAAVSFYVNCETQDEVDDLWDKLVDGGTALRCGWLKDKFGVHWQVIPTTLPRYLRDKDKAKSQRVMEAMMQMIKIDVAALDRAYQGA